VTASVESGYTFKVGEYTTASDTVNTFYLQPKAQITWQELKRKTTQKSEERMSAAAEIIISVPVSGCGLTCTGTM
jgi:outer membrane autotransporter protein